MTAARTSTGRSTSRTTAIVGEEGQILGQAVPSVSGLDALRRNGWGGTGLVRWEHPTNRGFLRCVAELRRAADGIGEDEEVDRLAGFLVDLDPDWSDDHA